MAGGSQTAKGVQDETSLVSLENAISPVQSALMSSNQFDIMKEEIMKLVPLQDGVVLKQPEIEEKRNSTNLTSSRSVRIPFAAIPVALLGALTVLFSLIFSACLITTQETKEESTEEFIYWKPPTGPFPNPEVFSAAEIRLSDLRPAIDDYLIVGYNDSGHGVLFFLYETYIPEGDNARRYEGLNIPPLGEFFHYHLARYETDLLTDKFWDSEPISVHSCQQGEINGCDWDSVMTWFNVIRKSEKTHAEEYWDQDRSVGFWGRECERPILFGLEECSTTLSFLQAEYEILGTKQHLIIGVYPSDKKE